jgi:hypothetical protein
MRQPILAIIATLSTLLPVVAGLYRRRLLSKDSTVLFGLFGVVAGLAVYELILATLNRNNLWVGQVSSLIETTVMLLLYAIWVNNHAITKGFRGIAVVYALFWLALKFESENLDKPSNITAPISSVLLASGAIIVLYQLAQNNERSIVSDWRFWIVTSILLESSTNLMFFALMKVILTLPFQEIIQIYSFYWILVIISNLLNAGGMLCMGYQSNSGGRLVSAV